jgi:hypothetical protein
MVRALSLPGSAASEQDIFNMLLPDKHITIAASILGLSGLILSVLEKPTAFNVLMETLEQEFETADWPAFHTVESVSLALSFLYMVEVVDVAANGEIMRCD